MKIVILCGGKGTRIREETEYRPKPMVPIGGKPILWHIMKTYSFWGHNEFVLCLGYKGEMIKDYFRNYLWNTCDVTVNLGQSQSVLFHDRHAETEWTVTLADTGEDSMTGCRVHRIKKYIPENHRFLLTYGDGLADIDINASIDSHKRSGKQCTLTAVHPSGRFGALQLDENGLIHTFEEKPQFEKSFINGGFMVCDYSVFDYLSDDPQLIFEKGPLESLARSNQLNAYKHEGFWRPMDTFQEMQHLNSLWVQGRAPWKVWE